MILTFAACCHAEKKFGAISDNGRRIHLTPTASSHRFPLAPSTERD
jgi:hypothetical protein